MNKISACFIKENGHQLLLSHIDKLIIIAPIPTIKLVSFLWYHFHDFKRCPISFIKYFIPAFSLYLLYEYFGKKLTVQKSTQIKRKPIGLKNTKETCYMNSMMHALAASPKLIYILTRTMNEHKNNTSFLKFLNILNSLNGDVKIDPTNQLISFINEAHWNRNSQEDAFQLLSFLINFIQTDAKLENIVMPPKFQILHRFTENPRFNKVQAHLAISLPLCGNFMEPPGESLPYLLDNFFKLSLIDDGPFGTQLYLFKEAPEVMLLHIQANEWDNDEGKYVKPKYYIKYEESFTYDFKIQKEKDGSKCEDEKVTYRLMAVVKHMGIISGGHYITYRRLDDQWYMVNDEQVEKMDFDNKVVPYIMVYERNDTESL